MVLFVKSIRLGCCCHPKRETQREENMKEHLSLCIAWGIACVAVCCSVYVSESFGLENCTLCWLQKMCMYPLAIILGMAVYNHSYAIIPYVMPQVYIGFALASYQTGIQTKFFQDFLSFCQGSTNCLEPTTIGLGFVTLPILSTCAFCIIMGCLLFSNRQAQLKPQPVYVKIK